MLAKPVNRAEWAKKLKEEIIELQKIQKILLRKTPTYPFLYPVVENAIYAMTNLLTYVEDKNPFFKIFAEDYFANRNITMHKTFFNDLHIGTEDGLRQIIQKNNFPMTITREEKAKSLVERISNKIKESSKINGELKEILELVGTHPTFNDYLNCVLNNIPSLSTTYIKGCRIFFDGFNIIRNKVSHSDMTLSESEKEKLIKAKLTNAISPDGKSIQMTFEGYKLLISDIIRLFDRLYANI